MWAGQRELRRRSYEISAPELLVIIDEQQIRSLNETAVSLLTFFLHADFDALPQSAGLALPPVVLRNAALVVVRAREALRIFHAPPARQSRL